MSAPKKSLGDAWAEQMKSSYSAELEARERQVDSRVEGGKQFISNEVRKLVGWIERIGAPADANSKHPGKPCTTFGPLFDAVKDDMQAVSSTLKTARRMGIVDYEGEHLLQGASDAVPIFLLDSKPGDIVVSDRGNGAPTTETDPFKIDLQMHEVKPCWRCGRDVFPQDRIGVASKILHRSCFECFLDDWFVCFGDIILPICLIRFVSFCSSTQQLTPSRYASITVDGQLRFYCIPHYKRLFLVNADYTTGFKADGGIVVGGDEAEAGNRANQAKDVDEIAGSLKKKGRDLATSDGSDSNSAARNAGDSTDELAKEARSELAKGNEEKLAGLYLEPSPSEVKGDGEKERKAPPKPRKPAQYDLDGDGR